MTMEDKIFLSPGEVVTLKQDIPNKPLMVVVRKETSIFKYGEYVKKKPVLLGIRCMWFTTDGTLQEAVFSTKDLQLVKK